MNIYESPILTKINKNCYVCPEFSWNVGLGMYREKFVRVDRKIVNISVIFYKLLERICKLSLTIYMEQGFKCKDMYLSLLDEFENP